MRIITIIGARPQFVKAAIVSRYIRLHNDNSSIHIEEKLLHTGQHYDYNMSQVFFEQMGIPTPTWHLGCTNDVVQMRNAIIPLIKDNADYIMVYGDTNSTLAGALAAEACNIPLIHIEAGCAVTIWKWQKNTIVLKPINVQHYCFAQRILRLKIFAKKASFKVYIMLEM